ncbi:hypothetical protein ON010_g1508 [Phytophthora cinnamomi]|nr:hypothetical protein ON010_g1508 [Phytophthora cinnamomi]
MAFADAVILHHAACPQRRLHRGLRRRGLARPCDHGARGYPDVYTLRFPVVCGRSPGPRRGDARLRCITVYWQPEEEKGPPV